MSRALDDSLSRLSGKLQALGLWERTLLLLHGDNGASWLAGGSNHPLRGRAIERPGREAGLVWMSLLAG